MKEYKLIFMFIAPSRTRGQKTNTKVARLIIVEDT